MTPPAVHSPGICCARASAPGYGAAGSAESRFVYTSWAVCGAAQSTTVKSSAQTEVNGWTHSPPPSAFHGWAPGPTAAAGFGVTVGTGAGVGVVFGVAA